mgnify:CR=1 FL=1
MKAEVVSMKADKLDMEAIRRGGDILKQGGLVAFPTETVYGLGGDALNPQASMKIYAAKGRPSDNPLIVHIAEFDKLAPIVAEVPEKAKILAEKYWPGPLTMILPKSDLVPQETTGGLERQDCTGADQGCRRLCGCAQCQYFGKTESDHCTACRGGSWRGD